MSLRIISGNAASAAPGLHDESRLVAAAQQGDGKAFHCLYESYRDRIHSLIHYSLRDPQQAEDVLQTVFLKAFQAIRLFRADSSFLTWLYRITLNECKNAKTRRKFWVPLSELFQRPEERDPAPSPELIHISDRQTRAIREVLLKLKPRYRDVVLLKYQEDLSYEEVAEILGVSAGTVASRLHRALKILESCLRER